MRSWNRKRTLASHSLLLLPYHGPQYWRDEEGYGGEPQSKFTSLDDDGAVLVRKTKFSDQPETLSKSCCRIKKKLIQQNFLLTDWLTN